MISDNEQTQRPYRPCVGVCLINENGLIFVGEREDFPNAWQMPQGGMDDGEDVITAAFRELAEETGVTKEHASIIHIMDQKIRYDLPAPLQKKFWGGKFAGQEQTWVAMKFNGSDADINLNAHEPIEFIRWKWVQIETLPDLIVPFKRDIYIQVATTFKPFTKI